MAILPTIDVDILITAMLVLGDSSSYGGIFAQVCHLIDFGIKSYFQLQMI